MSTVDLFSEAFGLFVLFVLLVVHLFVFICRVFRKVPGRFRKVPGRLQIKRFLKH